MIPEIALWMFATGWHLVANQAVARVGQAHYRSRSSQPAGSPLLDLGHRMLPHVRLSPLADTALHYAAFGPPLCAIVSGHGVLLLKIHAVLLLLRPLCFLGTVLPDASGVGKVPCLISTRGGVHDLMFSGHAALCLAGAWVMYFSEALTPSGIGALSVWCVVQSLAIVAAHKHYTVDVVVVWILCPLLVEHFTHAG
jgi:hypothetical protein